MMKRIALFLLLLPVIVRAQLINTIAGGGTGGDNIPATAASIPSPQGIALDKWGNLYISDLGGCTIRKVDTRHYNYGSRHRRYSWRQR